MYENVYKLKSFSVPFSDHEDFAHGPFSVIEFSLKQSTEGQRRTLNSAPFSSLYQKSFIKTEQNTTKQALTGQCLKTQTPDFSTTRQTARVPAAQGKCEEGPLRGPRQMYSIRK